MGPLVVAGGTTCSNSASISFQFGTGTAAPTSGTYKLVSNADAAVEVQFTVARTLSGAVQAYMSRTAAHW